jgi:nucleotide-binding universal stress UspA family protein
MKIKTILFPSDLSTAESAAFEYAADLAAECDAKLLIAHVQEPSPVYAEGNFYVGIPLPDYEVIAKMLAAIKPNRPGVRYEHRLLTGEPAPEVAGLARREEADLIVMSSHGRSGFGRFLMGSIAEGVVRAAPCPVLIVKPTCKLRDGEPTKANSKRRGSAAPLLTD